VTSISHSAHRRIVVGVDTHKYAHVAAALDELGARLGDTVINVNRSGYADLERWAREHGDLITFGIEGTGSYGAGLASFLRRRGHRVVEVNRPDRRIRYLQGKDDPLDAESAARAVLSGVATATPKSADGTVEMIRQIKIAKDTARSSPAAKPSSH
jgi:transposase